MEKRERRHDIDLLRVLSFGTMIVYHTSLLYGTKTWLLNSEENIRLIDLIAVGSHPWRMSLLFFLSGLVTSSLLERKSVDEILRSRTRQLLLPLVVGVVLIVPPQIYLSQFNPLPELSYWEFWKVYVISGIRLEHMWFLAYLWIYIFVWSLVWPRLERYWPGIPSAFASSLKGANLFAAPIIYLSVLRLWLYPIVGETSVITNDPYAHILYFSMFMAGSLLMNERNFWREIDRQRWVSCGLAFISFLAMATIVVAIPREQWPDTLVVMMRIVRSVFQWCAIIALLAFARRIATRPNPVVAHLNKSILTYYVIHQTIIIILAHLASVFGFLDVTSFVPIVFTTVLICMAIAETKRRTSIYLSPLTPRLTVFRRRAPAPGLP
ncbi:MAG: acyltransferase [Mesorhizobium sp.]|uniref:acyltransferase family protein n=1 Tax=Mesorhizobium sp. TaxID=1871066 RepID=UPI001AC52CF2|nr:acyltransferase [Mesorhizobium sp.]MBN9219434.1 acyltransferase [Mesorhizobium sp.]